ncbi:hypothetical protein POX_a00810 [Penicillium oxalicum]|uniref:G-protein coupled receptors family 2 profile 2 domain-containing protein n=1 Tax=Penicillium oxalicum (strain 114-2 / CGMCC 5302) TaxID=933388 RepID=S8BGH1_PENO1|nr:hypothetical protein POX_a00810 [Penicillium oxalicum]EPS34217.1 hypothetical protein PDE_09181 [Penicillium oxalicum 114-2]KAI2794220.1 hypothetical protein POX_a00810 [Penicillium oxalicum]
MQSAHGYCPGPFYQENLFPSEGGFIGGRYCSPFPVPGANGTTVNCCLPCPFADLRYANDTAKRVEIGSWISVAMLPLCIFLLISYAVLPVKWTNRHYLSICFTLGICCMEIAFIIPLGAKPDQCFNAITPNDMYSDLSCAFSGSLLLFGGWLVVMWSFIRTVAFHLQVCWELVLGPKFMWLAFLTGFGIPAVGLTVMLILTGVSFRFGRMCHINTEHGSQDYWYPLIAFTAAALVLQFFTMLYCIHVYVRSLFDKSSSTTDTSTGLPSYTSSVRTATARQAYRRVQRVVRLQWRGAALVLIILANVIFFAVVFIKMDETTSTTPANMEKATNWIVCLALGGSREQCQQLATGFGPDEGTLLAVVYLLSLVGFWNFILFARPSIFAGWLDFIRNGFSSSSHEFVSADAYRNADHKGFEMLTTSSGKGAEPYYNMRSPSPDQMRTIGGSPPPVVRSPSPTYNLNGRGSPMATSPTSERSVHFRHQEARYTRPSLSFSGPRPPTSPTPGGRDWDPAETFARGHV